MKRRWLLTACLLPCLAAAVAVLADDHQEARRLMESGSILPLEQVMETIRKQRPGRILEVELEREHGGYLYEIELLDTDGRVWEMKIDAVSGQLLKTEEEH